MAVWATLGVSVFVTIGALWTVRRFSTSKNNVMDNSLLYTCCHQIYAATLNQGDYLCTELGVARGRE